MGIYLPNMETPTSCGYCPFKHRTMEGDECMFDVAYTTYQSRPDDCPLVPVPAHGRLIDADALEETDPLLCDCIIAEDGFVEWSEWGYSREQIRNAPTIIPASEEGE